MKDGDLALTALPQRDGATKDRPVLVLRRIPPFDDLLVCGVSSQTDQLAPELDELITPNEPDFRTSGLKAPSLIRLGFLATLPQSAIKGRIGSVSRARLLRLRHRLAEFLRPPADKA